MAFTFLTSILFDTHLKSGAEKAELEFLKSQWGLGTEEE